LPSEAGAAFLTILKMNYDLRDPRWGFFSCDWRIFIFFRFGLVIENVPLP
jgi:hypothetical protein